MPEPLPPTEVHLWLTRPERATGAALVEAYRALLAPDERARNARFAFEARRHEDLVTRALVRTVLSRYVALPPAAWRFVREGHGRPEPQPPCGVRFNVSNASGLVACAVARGVVGVDVEAHGRGEALVELAGAVLSDAERRALEALPDGARADRALSLWTLKEAYLKARGLGLSLPLQELAFELRGGAVHAAFGPALGDDPSRWGFRLLDHASHRVALATEPGVRVRAWEVVPGSAGPEVALPDRGGPA